MEDLTPQPGENAKGSLIPNIAEESSGISKGQSNARRGFVVAGAVGLLAAGAQALTGCKHSDSGSAAPSRSQGAPAPAVQSPAVSAKTSNLGQMSHVASWKSPELRLARRITMGLNDAEARRATQMGYEAYLEYQFNYASIDDSEVENYISRHLPTVAMKAADIRSQYTLHPGVFCSQLLEATLRRSIGSKRQFYQRMVEFWTDHFNIYLFGNPPATTFAMPQHDRDVIRAYALDTFPNLLKATARSPAMMRYLDNATSVASSPNQNYARELMELMTMGVDGGYTQQDVIEVARCFTGWSITGSPPNFNQTSDAGAFEFKPDMHDNGEKVVLGHTIPAGGGQSDGETVLDILARHPSAAHHIARKLCVWLLQYDPPQSVVDSVAQTYQSTGGDIRAMVRVILQKSNLMAAPPKYKRPYHLIVSAIRAAGATLGPWFWNPSQVSDPQFNYKNPRLMVAFLWPNGSSWMGHTPFLWSEPNGYPDSLAHWTGLLLPRCNFAALLAENQLDGLKCDVSNLMRAGSAENVARAIDETIFAGEMPTHERNDIADFLRETGENPIKESSARQALALALASPAFQWY